MVGQPGHRDAQRCHQQADQQQGFLAHATPGHARGLLGLGGLGCRGRARGHGVHGSTGCSGIGGRRGRRSRGGLDIGSLRAGTTAFLGHLEDGRLVPQAREHALGDAVRQGHAGQRGAPDILLLAAHAAHVHQRSHQRLEEEEGDERDHEQQDGQAEQVGCGDDADAPRDGCQREQQVQRVTDPREPARDEVVALCRRQVAAAEQGLRVRLHDLDGALSPALALLLEGEEGVGREAATHHHVHIAQRVALIHQAQGEFRVLADGPFRPLALQQRLGAHQRHGAVLDDGVALVAVVHADAEEAVVLVVHHPPEGVAAPAPVGLRRLHHGGVRIIEVAHHILQPATHHHVVGIHHADDLGIGRRLRQPVVERASLEAGPLGQVEELEVLGQRGHELLDRLPELLVLRVVVDDQHFEVAVVQRGQALDGGDHHVGLLVAAGQVQRYLGFTCTGGQRTRAVDVAQVARPEHLDELEEVREQDGGHGQQRRHQDHQEGPVDRAHVVVEGQGHQPGEQRDDGLQHQTEGDAAGQLQVGEAEHEPEQRHHADGRRQGGLGLPVGVTLDGAGQAVLGLAVGVQVAPVRAGPAFQLDLPGLVDALHQEVVDVLGGSTHQEAPDELGLAGGRGPGGVAAVALAGPAHLTDHDLLVGEAALHLVQSAEGVLQRLLDRQAFPVGQQVDRDEVGVGGQLGIAQPDVPGLGRGDRLAHPALDLAHVLDELGRGAAGVQHLFVTDDDPFDGAGVMHRLLDGVEFLLVALLILADPDTGRQVQAGLLGQGGNLGLVDAAVGPHPRRVVGQDLEVLLDRGLIGVAAIQRVVPALGGVVGQAADLAVEGRRVHQRVDLVPGHEVQHGQRQGEECGAHHAAEGDRMVVAEMLAQRVVGNGVAGGGLGGRRGVRSGHRGCFLSGLTNEMRCVDAARPGHAGGGRAPGIVPDPAMMNLHGTRQAGQSLPYVRNVMNGMTCRTSDRTFARTT